MQDWTLRDRILRYAALLALSFLLPYVVLTLSLFFTGGQEIGMLLGMGFSLLTINIFYAFYFLKISRLKNFLFGLLVSIISTGFTFILSFYDIQFSNDNAGFWTGFLAYGLASILTWEILYKFFRKTLANTTQVKKAG